MNVPHVELDTQLMELSLGPQHPSTHGVFRMNVVLDGKLVYDRAAELKRPARGLGSVGADEWGCCAWH